MRKYKYDGKEYDFDSYKKQAIDNFDSWASERNLSSTRTEKIRQAMLELLQHMTDDERSGADLRRINFSTEYANTKGIFGKNVKDSKHYQNATAYLLGQFNSSTPFQEQKPEEKPKTKVSRQLLGQWLADGLGNTSTYTDEQKRIESARAFNQVLQRLSGPDTDYEVEEGYDLPTFRNWLQEGATAAGTNDNFVDDNIYWGRLGITNPFFKPAQEQKPEQMNALQQAKQQWINAGLSEEQWNQALPTIQNVMAAGLLKQFGLDNDQAQLIVPPAIKQPAQKETPAIPSQKKPLTTKTFDYGYYASTAKPWIERNISNLNDPKWKDIDAYMAKLVESQLKGEKNSNVKPQLKKITFEGKPYYVVSSLNTGNNSYVYNPEDKQMYLIPKVQSYVVYKKKKGGYLLKLRSK